MTALARPASSGKQRAVAIPSLGSDDLENARRQVAILRRAIADTLTKSREAPARFLQTLAAVETHGVASPMVDL